MSIFMRSDVDPDDYLLGDEIIEVDHPAVRALAVALWSESGSPIDYARNTFEWVRDKVGHSYDVRDPRVTLTASEVLEHRVGLCYAKSNLLTALLRAQGIPTALCYQRLAHGEGHVIHGLVAVHLDGGWYRQDPRGNNAHVTAEFSIGEERLAYSVDPAQGEIDYPQLFRTTAPVVVDALRAASDTLAIYDAGLPSDL
ncbi:transglutaminase family protein [Nocardia yamanashiensis]|uniref:transglutaminase-like domain-containing protein n=1 Tax=Nocardia yamanashiensis TaxID=209247 RepID=UPI001E346705|nr:transglutaminase family protein [Nocardia yamanashiensis]UGT44122.1 transglutaminase family protein [Nocardia yamanashiensis]